MFFVFLFYTIDTMRILLFSLGLSLTVLCLPVVTKAQSLLSPNLTTDSIGITVTPPNPEAYENVTISIESYGFDISAAQITWKNGTKTLLSGIGQSVYSFRTGEAGKSYVLDITVSLGGQTTQKKLLIQVNNLDILWEATNSYTPPFYKGKALPGPEAQIKITAIPTGNPQSTVFEWRKNDKAVSSANGVGKQSYTFSLNYLNSEEVIDVTARAQSGAYRTNGTLTIQSIAPEIQVYQESGVEGVFYNRAITNSYTPRNSGFTLGIEPYFFSIGRNKKNASYEWTNTDSGEITTSRTISLAKNGSGTAVFSIQAGKVGSIFEQIVRRLTLNI